MINADEIDTLLFDILGTVVDEAGSMRAELGSALDQAGAGQRTEALAAAWQRHFAALAGAIVEGAPWRSTDDLNAEALAGALRDGPRLPEATVRELGLAGHRLRPWPDTQDALHRLARRFAIVALSNGNLSMLTDLFAAGGLTWHGVLSGELVHAYKPNPAVYRLALDRLALDPRRTLMVAAHPWDLRAAAALGLRTAYIERRRRRSRTIRHVRPHRPRPGRPRLAPTGRAVNPPGLPGSPRNPASPISPRTPFLPASCHLGMLERPRSRRINS